MLAFSVFFSFSEAEPLKDLTTDPDATEHTIPDDGYVEVPLDFEYPFYGRTFTNSWMFANGVIGFLDPTEEPYQGQYGFCCTGYDNSVDRPASKLTLMPLQTDLINYGDGKFMTKGDEDSMTYGWYNISEYGRPDSSNTFEAEIFPDGMYQFRYGDLDVSRGVTIGSTGDPSEGEYEQYLYGTLPPNGVETITSYGLGGQCVVNPLADPNCPGYADAYAEQEYEQNCAADPLYDSGCPGYSEAYYEEQCSINPLYDSGCPRYEDALLEEECSVDPLSNESCSGYDDAYFAYQCEENPLYDSSCPGYETAYFDYQCEQNTLFDSACPGYEQAFFDQQCSNNPLYNESCPGYEQAFFDQQCSADPLYDTGCPGYEQAFFDQQCSNDPLYDSGCPGYEEAFAQQQLDRTCSANPQSDPRCDGYTNESAEVASSESSNKSDTLETMTSTNDLIDEYTEPEITGDSTVDSILRDGSDSANVTDQPEPVPMPEIEPAPVENRSSSDESSSSSSEETSEKEEKQSPDRRKKLKEIAEREARDLADEMSKAATAEQQMATQARVMSLISYVPGFGSYAQKGIPQPTNYYSNESIYEDRTIPDSNFGARNGLAQEILHERMVDMQYNKREGND